MTDAYALLVRYSRYDCSPFQESELLWGRCAALISASNIHDWLPNLEFICTLLLHTTLLQQAKQEP